MANKGEVDLRKIIFHLEDHNWNGLCLKLSKKLWEEEKNNFQMVSWILGSFAYYEMFSYSICWNNKV